ncbi:helix-turn-helix transcriptional regulator [Oricola sp.]|uniref:helix-turn-helix transcriptional regulator n=1 Tax=Oricola sp. TaxID=1979950 RepID=UPI0025D0BA0A|nr:helix-turn-helix transcriptional regulator [Oricola sp.]MCI5073658.1 helix-turn-helix transcriptional regulator [Oricola sp.]
MGKKDDDDRTSGGKLVETDQLGAFFAKLHFNGTPLRSEPLWEERVREIITWLPDPMRKEMLDTVSRVGTSGAAPDLETFAADHGLTPAETRLVESLLAGASVAEHAESLGISNNTARVHMQRVLEKTGARRQAELVRMLLA